MKTLTFPEIKPRLRNIFNEAQIQAALDYLAAQLIQDYASAEKDEREAPVMVPVMNGAMVFASELLKRIPFPIMLECIQLTRVKNKDPQIPGKGTVSEASGGESFSTQWLKKAIVERIAGRRVILVDAVLDHGITLAEAQKVLLEQGAREVKVVVLIEKWRHIAKPCVPDYRLFAIPGGDFVVGFGMDGYGWCRNLNAIMAID
jgi:hypoxanthine phosphoribosyltransferase